MLRDDLIPSSLSSACATFDANCVPRSEIILSGRPYRRQVWSKSSFAVSSESIDFLHGVMIAVFVKRSVTTCSESYPFDSGRSVTKSIVIVPNGRSGISVGCNGTIVGCVSFFVD